MKNYTIRFAILLVSLVLTQIAYADVKVKTRQTMSGQTTESTTFIKGKRQRLEQSMGGMQTEHHAVRFKARHQSYAAIANLYD